MRRERGGRERFALRELVDRVMPAEGGGRRLSLHGPHVDNYRSGSESGATLPRVLNGNSGGRTPTAAQSQDSRKLAPGTIFGRYTIMRNFRENDGVGCRKLQGYHISDFGVNFREGISTTPRRCLDFRGSSAGVVKRNFRGY